ncbi:MAG: hypothetical protein ONB44_25075 [candidate division KSB1 bacterium]|nr:hypothetical protein [candidate division KSB1 bacterium]MDZ7305406.1 hypothetical protein [candidate division KSB1 bacterium]
MERLTIKNLPNKEERAQIGKAARAIYEPLREALERDHWGEYIAINVKNGDYVVSASHEDAARQMHARYPGEFPFVIRIGYRAVYHFGGSGLNDGKRP